MMLGADILADRRRFAGHGPRGAAATRTAAIEAPALVPLGETLPEAASR
jgi:hypothetical protein